MDKLSDILLIIGLVAILGIPTITFILSKIIGFGIRVVLKVLLKVGVPIAVIVALIYAASKVFNF